MVFLIAYIGIIQYTNYKLKTKIAEQKIEIFALETQVASEKSKTKIFENKIEEVTERLKSTTLLLSERQVIIEQLENDRSSLNKKLKSYDIEFSTIKEAEEFVNNTFKASLECLEAASGKGESLCID